MARGEQESDAVRFERLEQQRAHEYVAEQIRRQIVLRLIPSGQALPTERELAASFGVGRATVQQAIRLLVKDHMVESRRGRHGGGNFVLGPGRGPRGSRGDAGAAAAPPRPRSRTRSPTGARSSPRWPRSPPRRGREADLRTLAGINAAAAARGDRRRVHAGRHGVPPRAGRGLAGTACSARRSSGSGSSSTTR